MKKYILIVGFNLVMLFTQAQVTDFDGNVYDTVTIGNQVWLKQNIKSTHYADGSPVNPSKMFDYNNDPALGSIYGKLYTYSAVMHDSLFSVHQGICPNEYHVATDVDWGTLGYYLGGDTITGSKIKDTILWNMPNAATNGSGFSALPGGAWSLNFGFGLLGSYAWFWAGGSNASYNRYLINDNGRLFTFGSPTNGEANAYSCRCIRNLPVSLEEAERFQKVSVYPNPATVIINVEQKDKSIKLTDVTLIDVYGTKYKASMTEKSEIDVSELPAGIYFLELKTNVGACVKKIIVQH
jgi:uncharacterized protein (TIGR02145 family)